MPVTLKMAEKQAVKHDFRLADNIPKISQQCEQVIIQTFLTDSLDFSISHP